jgi:hypothetical protein
MVTVTKLFCISISLLFLSCCQKESSREFILFDFESDSELDQLYWNCHTLYSLSTDHVTHGSRSLKLEVYPSDYPGLIPMLPVTDWRGYGEFSFDVFNPSEQALRIGVRIDDRKDYPDSADRYNKNFVVIKGNNHIVIPLETLISSGSNRPLNLAQIQRLYIFMRHPVKKTILYIDNLQILRK